MKVNGCSERDRSNDRMTAMTSSLMRFSHTVAAIAALLALHAVPAHAEQIPALCSKERNQAEMTRCADQLLRKDRAEMAKTLEALLKETDKDSHTYVNEAQAAWQAYADKECLSRIGGSPNRGGTIWPMMNLQCHVGLTRLRIKDLKEQVKCPGGRRDC
jgi:uncharacterized protein YecT (DUF1311 family)